jgi:uncharacterized protein (DUF4415 family)
MKKKYTELSASELLTKRKGKSTFHKVKDSEIDYSDIPEFSTAELKKFKRVGRPLVGDSPREAISLRVESDVLDKLKKQAKNKGVGYQSLINAILKKAV